MRPTASGLRYRYSYSLWWFRFFLDIYSKISHDPPAPDEFPLALGKKLYNIDWPISNDTILGDVMCMCNM